MIVFVELFLSTSASIVSRSSPVISRHKDGCNGKEVVGKFLAVVVWTVWRTVNHEFCASFRKDGVHKVIPESAQSVTVHDHNLLDHSVDNGVQKGFKTFPFEVDAAPNVGDEFMGRERLLEILLLAGKVVALVGRRDAGVDNASTSFIGRFDGIVAQEFSEVVHVVQTFPLIPLEAHVPERAAISPRSEGLFVDCVGLLYVSSGNKGCIIRAGALGHP